MSHQISKIPINSRGSKNLKYSAAQRTSLDTKFGMKKSPSRPTQPISLGVPMTPFPPLDGWSQEGVMLDGWCYQLILSTKKNSTFYIHPEKLMAGNPKWRWMEDNFPFQFGNFSCSTTLGKGGKKAKHLHQHLRGEISFQEVQGSYRTSGCWTNSGTIKPTWGQIIGRSETTCRKAPCWLLIKEISTKKRPV